MKNLQTGQDEPRQPGPRSAIPSKNTTRGIQDFPANYTQAKQEGLLQICKNECFEQLFATHLLVANRLAQM